MHTITLQHEGTSVEFSVTGDSAADNSSLRTQYGSDTVILKGPSHEVLVDVAKTQAGMTYSVHTTVPGDWMADALALLKQVYQGRTRCPSHDMLLEALHTLAQHGINNWCKIAHMEPSEIEALPVPLALKYDLTELATKQSASCLCIPFATAHADLCAAAADHHQPPAAIVALLRDDMRTHTWCHILHTDASKWREHGVSGPCEAALKLLAMKRIGDRPCEPILSAVPSQDPPSKTPSEARLTAKSLPSADLSLPVISVDEEKSASLFFRGTKFAMSLAGRYVAVSLRSLMSLPLEADFPPTWNKLYVTLVWLLLSYAQRRDYNLPSTQLVLEERRYLDSILDDFNPSGYKYASTTLAGVKCDIMRCSGVSRHATGADTTHDVMLYLHGGTFISMSPKSFRPLVAGMTKRTNVRVTVIPDYRRVPEFPYPAALDDAFAVYCHLLHNLHFPPSRVVLAGDSAGGTLALALLLCLKDRHLPLPMCALLLSPWVDLDYRSQICLDDNGQPDIIEHYNKAAAHRSDHEGSHLPMGRHTVDVEECLCAAGQEKLRALAESEGECLECNSESCVSNEADGGISCSNRDAAGPPFFKIHPGDRVRYKNASMNENFGKDVVDPRFDCICAQLYADGHDPRDPLVSPLFGDFAGLCPCLVHTGGLEVTRDEQVELVERLQAAHVTVSHRVFENEVHDFQTFPGAPHQKESFKLTAAFLDSCRKTSTSATANTPPTGKKKKGFMSSVFG